MREQWILATLGVLSKHYAEGEKHLEAFRDMFEGFIFGIMNKESKITYKFSSRLHAKRCTSCVTWT